MRVKPDDSPVPELLPTVTVPCLDIDLAQRVLLRGEFERRLKRAVEFYLALFPADPQIYDAAAVRMMEESEPRKALAILDKGLASCAAQGLLTAEKAAMLGMTR